MLSLEELDKLKVKKTFTNGRHADKVYLLEGGIIKKSYKRRNESIKLYRKEIDVLTHLGKCKYVSKLINYDESKLILYVEYCGVKPSRSEKNLERIRKIAKKLHKKYGLVRYYTKGDERIKETGSKIQYDIYLGNTGINKNGKIKFFDFGSDNWHIKKKK